MGKKYAGTYTGKYKIGQEVYSTPNAYPNLYWGKIVSILDGDDHNNAYGVHWYADGLRPDGKLTITYMSEEDLEVVNDTP